jgi:hypothetical protein
MGSVLNLDHLFRSIKIHGKVIKSRIGVFHLIYEQSKKWVWIIYMEMNFLWESNLNCNSNYVSKNVG